MKLPDGVAGVGKARNYFQQSSITAFYRGFKFMIYQDDGMPDYITAEAWIKSVPEIDSILDVVCSTTCSIEHVDWQNDLLLVHIINQSGNRDVLAFMLSRLTAIRQANELVSI